jgi:hypothetical protein
MIFKKLKNTQKIRLLINGVCIYGTVKQIHSMVMNSQVDLLFRDFDRALTDDPNIKGIGSNYEGLNLQVDFND